MAEQLQIIVTAKDSGAARTLLEIGRNAQDAGRDVEQASKKGEQSFRRLGDSAKQSSVSLDDLGAAATVMGAGLAFAGNAALDQQQTIIGLRSAYGDAADEMIRFADEMAAVTIFNDDDILAGERYFATLRNNYNLSIDQIQELMRTTADLASAAGTTFEDASSRVTAAIRGEGEAAEYLGLTMNQQAIDRNNLTLTMSNQEAAQFRLNALYEQTGVYAGTAQALAESEVGTRARLTNAIQDNAQALGNFIGPLGSMVGGLGLAITGVSGLLGPLGRMASGTRAASLGVSALGLAFNPLTLGIAGAVAVGAGLYTFFDRANERANSLSDGIEGLTEQIEALKLVGEVDTAAGVQNILDSINAQIELLSGADLEPLVEKLGLPEGTTLLDLAALDSDLQTAEGLTDDFAEHITTTLASISDPAAQQAYLSWIGDLLSGVEHTIEGSNLDEIMQRVLITPASEVPGVMAEIDGSFASTAESATGLGAAFNLLQDEAKGFFDQLREINTVSEDDSFGERLMKSLGLDASQRGMIAQTTEDIQGLFSTLDDMPEVGATQGEWMEWVNTAERGSTEWARRVQLANEARQAEAAAANATARSSELAIDRLGTYAARLEEVALLQERAGEAGASFGEAAAEQAAVYGEAMQALTDAQTSWITSSADSGQFLDFWLDLDSAVGTTTSTIGEADGAVGALLGGMQGLADAGSSLDFRAVVGLADDLSDAGAALDSVLNTFSQIDAIGSRFDSAVGIAEALVGEPGEWAAIDDLISRGRISLEEYNAANLAGVDIQMRRAEVADSLNVIRAKQIPLLNEEAAAYQDNIRAISELPALEQRRALALQDSAVQAQLATQYSTAYAASMGEIPEEVATQMIVSAAEADPVIKDLLLNMGLVEEGAEGDLRVNFPDAGTVEEAITGLTDSIDALTLAMGGVPPMRLEVEGMQDVEAAKTALDDVLKSPNEKTVAVNVLESGLDALKNFLNPQGDGTGGAAYEVEVGADTNPAVGAIAALSEDVAPVEVPVTPTLGSLDVGDGTGGAANWADLLPDVEVGVTADTSIAVSSIAEMGAGEPVVKDVNADTTQAARDISAIGDNVEPIEVPVTITTAGEDFGSAVAGRFAAAGVSSQDQTVTVTIDAVDNASPVIGEVITFAASVNDYETSVTVNANTDDATADINEVIRAYNDLGNATASVTITANTEDAKTDINEVIRAYNDLSTATATVTIDGDSSGAATAIEYARGFHGAAWSGAYTVTGESGGAATAVEYARAFHGAAWSGLYTVGGDSSGAASAVEYARSFHGAAWGGSFAVSGDNSGAMGAINEVAAYDGTSLGTAYFTVTTREVTEVSRRTVAQHGGIPGYAMGGVAAELAEAGGEMLHFAGGGHAYIPDRGIYEIPRHTYVEPANSVGNPGGGSAPVVLNNYGTIIGVDDLTKHIGVALIKAQKADAARHNRAHGRVS